MKKILLILFISFLVANIHAQTHFTSYNSGTDFSAVTVDGVNSKVWAGTTQNGVFSFDIASSSNFSIFNNSATNGPALNNIIIKSMAADKYGNIWIGHQGINFSGGQGGMERINSQLNTKHFSSEANYVSGVTYIRRDGLATRKITSICVDKNDKVWTAHKYNDLTTGSSYYLQPGAFSYKNPNELNFTTYGGWRDANGQVNIQPAELPYPAYTINPGPTVTSQSRTMDAIACDDTEMYIAVRGYLKRGENNQTDSGYIEPRLLSYRIDDNSNYNSYTFSDLGFTPGGVINAICANDAKGIWVTNSIAGKGFAVRHVGIWYHFDSNSVDSDNVAFSKLIPENTRFNTNAIWKDRTGRVFMGTDKGLIVFNGKGNPTKADSYRIYTNYEFGGATNPLNVLDPSMISNIINAGCADPNNVTESWVATPDGIMKLVLPVNELSLYHVKDHYTYGASTQDTADNITFLAFLKNKSLQQGLVEPAEENEIPKFGADGSTATIIRIPTDNPQGYYDLGNEAYKVFIGPADQIDKIYEADYIKRYGYFYLKDLSSYPNSPSSADQLDYVEFYYKHPEYIDADDYLGDNTYAEFDLKIYDVTDETNNIEVFKHPIKVALPPLLLGHGVWSSTASLDKMELYFKNNGYNEFLIAKAWRNNDALAENSFGEDAWVIPSYIKTLKNNAALNMFSAGKVNVIVHSRGGLYTRAYIEGMDPNYPFRKDINSLTTLNTPHSGSQAANLVMDRRIVKYSRFANPKHYIPKPIASLSELEFGSEDKPLGELISLVGFPPEADRANNWGAKNLLVVSDNLSGITSGNNPNFIENLNRSFNVQKLNGIPIHVVATTFEACQANSLFCNDITKAVGDIVNVDVPDDLKRRIPKSIFRSIWIYNIIEFGLNDVPQTVDGLTRYLYRTSLEGKEPNDLIVPITSMEAGLGGNFVSNFPGENIAHIDVSGHDFVAPNATGVTAAGVVHDKLLLLLRENVNDLSGSSSFTKTGLNPPIIPYLFLAGWTGEAARKSSGKITSKIFINKDPVVFDNVTEGDVLNYNIYAEDLDKIMITYENSVKNDSLIYEIKNPVSFENSMDYTIPTGYSGTIKIMASGYKNQKIVAIDTINFNVNIPTNISLQSIHFEHKDPIVLNQTNYSYNLIGTFSDGIERNINNFDGLTYAIEDASIISQIDNSSIKGETEGTTLLTATVNGLENSILVTVQEDQSLLQTIITGFYAVTANGNTTINVFWNTLREYENATFVLESSYNTPDNFTEVNQQNGNGTTTIPSQFNYSDTSIGTNTLIYYRLRMIDTFGGISYSSTIVINTSTLSDNDNNLIDMGLKLYPNPVNTDNVTLSVNSDLSNQNAKLELYNLQGKRLSLQSLNIVQGRNDFNLKLSSDLSNGIYLVRISTDGFIKTIKLVVNK